jgi:hypothetical protein
MPSRGEEKRTPRLEYPKHEIRFRPYGYLIESIISKMKTEEDCPEKEQTVINVANHLKKQYLNWNRNSVSDDLIADHLQELSDGKLTLKENFRFSSTQDILNEIEKTAYVNGNSNGKNNNKKKKKKNNMNNPQANANKNRPQNPHKPIHKQAHKPINKPVNNNPANNK